MRPVTVAPLVVAALLCVPLAVARYSDRVDRLLCRIGIRLFGEYVDVVVGNRSGRRAALRATHAPTTVRRYGATTLLYAAIAVIVGSIVGLYAIWGLLELLSIDPETLRTALPTPLEFLATLGGVPTLPPAELAVLLFGSSLTLGAIAGGGTYWFRWWYPGYVADARARRIEAGLPATVAFMYALSKSGMAFPEIIRIIATQEDTYGEAATEFSVAVRSMDTFGTDVITALQTMGRRSPSPQFGEFTENLVSVLQSGQGLGGFLERQYLDYREEVESQQEGILDLLATLAEAYVTVLVAGPLFLITVLVVIGITGSDTIGQLQLVVYVLLPLANLGCIVYLSMVTDKLDPSSGVDGDPDGIDPLSVEGGRSAAVVGSGTGPGPRPHPNVERVRYYRRLQGVRERFGHPIRTLIEQPSLTLAITVPIALAVVFSRLPAALEDGFDVAAVDDTIAVGAFGVVTVFAIAYELHRRRLERIEAAVPDLLDRLASVNEAGLSIVSAIDRVRDSDLGPLSAELDRVWNDVEWGADLQTALHRFEARVGTRSIARVVTLLTESMNASGNLATTLRIAARGAAADRRLKRERRQAMLEYMVVVYVSFLVFLFIIAVLAGYLLPNLPTETVDVGADSSLDGLGGFSDADADAYATLFYHATLVQGALSGLIAGQLSTGDIRAGAKHAAAMIALSVILFAILV
ncbi:type II secretion system F family protein [Natrinema longum]|uniref:Type II secretion system F family protein n=1 Tax=Natrinema longum TaxID=370324 RepID=A0A8A2U6G8_9EURY|nr:type II secretion system F family protein [Natrinema longum]MBZ6494376.1 type II secretion system F family protein [Natrinema longum]QSW84301.1 type II secretion system F family protein [Natrinema longum]